MIISVRSLCIFCVVIYTTGSVLAQRWRFQRYHYDPWTGKTKTSFEEFNEDVQNMNHKQLTKYLNELKKVKTTLNQMRRESEVLEGELGFKLGGFPSLMDNSESIINNALGSVTDQLQRRIGRSEDSQELEMRRRFDQKVRKADRQTLLVNLDRLKETKRELSVAKDRAQALKNDLGFELQEFPKAMERAEDIINHGMEIINRRLEKQDQSKTITHQPHVNQANVSDTVKKIENAIRTADKRRLTEFGNEFKKMKRFMDNMRSELRTFRDDTGFEVDRLFEPFNTAETILDRSLKTINRQLLAAGNGPADGPQQGVYNQQNPFGGSQQGGYNQSTAQTGRYNA